jgi:hypothetical protein
VVDTRYSDRPCTYRLFVPETLEGGG